MYAKIADGVIVKFPYTIEEMRTSHPELEIGNEPTPEQLSACGAVRAILDWTPTKSSRTHRFEPVHTDNGDGSVTITYNAVELPRDLAAFNMRDARDTALARCDWVVAKAVERGEPVPPLYAAYRDALRNLPEQIGFPFAVEWPADPSRTS